MIYINRLNTIISVIKHNSSLRALVPNIELIKKLQGQPKNKPNHSSHKPDE